MVPSPIPEPPPLTGEQENLLPKSLHWLKYSFNIAVLWFDYKPFLEVRILFIQDFFSLLMMFTIVSPNDTLISHDIHSIIR